MSTDLLGVSVSGLRVSQAKLSTTGRNIANAGVEGFSRQRVDLVTNPANVSGGGYIGSGVNVDAIERIANEFITGQLRTDTALFHELESRSDNLGQLDRLLADQSTGLSSGLQSFFSAMQNGSDDPTSIPARQLIISEAENLSDRFNTIYDRFETIEQGVGDALASGVSQVNALVQSIAELNGKVADATGVSNGAQPNDLLDQRDEALRALSELVSIQTYREGNNQINVLVGNGQNLVIGRDARELRLESSSEDPRKFDLMITSGEISEAITDLVSGGQVGGLLQFSSETMETVYNELGRIAVVMAETFNRTHQQGITLNNTFGGNFFYDVNNSEIAADRVIGNAANPPPNDRSLILNIADSSQLTASDYIVKMESGGLFNVERLDDNEVVSSGLLPGSFPFSAEFDGMELVFQGGTFQDGDSFLLQPVRNGGRDFASRLVDPSDIAFANPLLTDASIGNLGSGEISSGEVVSLFDNNGDPIALLQNSGEMNPPLVVQFKSPTVYDVLDNSDPKSPVQLEPPIRDQIYVPGSLTELFSSDPGETMVSTNGEMIGLPEGRSIITQASLQVAGAIGANYATSDFSGANTFSFDVSISNTLAGVNDTPAPVTVNISSPLINSDSALLTEINTQLLSTDASAYIDDNGALAFRLDSPGFGDITIDNYVGPVTPAAADNLFGYNISTLASGGASLTSAGNTDGFSGGGFLTNGYPAEAVAITRPSSVPGAAPITENIFTNLNASAREIATQLSNVSGVQANAFTYVELSDFDFSRSEPLQIAINGEDLLQYTVDSATGNSILGVAIPDPQTDPDAFTDYLEERINSNTSLETSGIQAVAARNAVTGLPELRVYGTLGDDLNIAFTSLSGESIGVSDGNNPYVTLAGAGSSVSQSVLVGGQLDVSLADGLTLSTFPPESMLFGDSGAADFARPTYLGIQAAISGIPSAGDMFTIDFNLDAASDNRNAISLVDLERADTIGSGTQSYAETYASLVEKVGIESNSTRINRDASEQVMNQSKDLRNSISAVNLDEEAADLIRYEQMFSANAQVISVARELFDRLISSF